MTLSFSVLIPDGEMVVPIHVARCLTQEGVKLYMLSSKRWTWPYFSRHCHPYDVRPIIADPEERFKAVVEIMERFKVDVILPVTGWGIEFVAAKYQALSEMAAIAPIPELQAYQIAQNKGLLAQFACEQHLPVPPFIPVTLDPAFYRQLSELEYPVLLKPTSEFGGRGIQGFENPADLERFLKSRDEKQFRNRYVVQGYVPGFDLGLSVLCRNGEILAFTIQQGLMAERFGPLKAMQFIKQEDVLENGKKLLSALKWSGVAHIDMRYDHRDGQVKILEINPRFWNSLPGSLAVGVNFPYLACLAALDIPFSVPPYRLGKYLHTGTAVKEFILRFFGRSHVNKFTFKETGLRFFLTDPLPEVVNLIAKRVRDYRNGGSTFLKEARFLDSFFADWFPEDIPN